MSTENESQAVAELLATGYNQQARARGNVTRASEKAEETMTGGFAFAVWLDGQEYVVNVFPLSRMSENGPLFREPAL